MNSQIEVFDKVLADLQAIKAEGDFLPDCSTKNGYEASKNFVLKRTTKARTALNLAHKTAKAYWIEGGKTVDAKKNELMNALLACEEPHKNAYKAIDEKKKQIKEAKEQDIESKITWFDQIIIKCINSSANEIEIALEECQDRDIDFNVFGKRTNEVIIKQRETISILTEKLTQQLRHESLLKKEKELDIKDQSSKPIKPKLDQTSLSITCSDFFEREVLSNLFGDEEIAVLSYDGNGNEYTLKVEVSRVELVKQVA